MEPALNSNRIVKLKASLMKQRGWTKTAIVAIWLLVVAIIVLLPSFVYLVGKNPWNWFGGMPSLEAIQNPENEVSSEVISSDGRSLGRYFRYHRSEIAYKDIPESLIKTLVISEDHRFFAHSGLDLWSYIRVIWGIVSFNPQGGGSTLSQQTAKNLFRTREEELRGTLAGFGPLDLLVSKTKEWIIATRLERNFTKEEIITLYLNTVYFNNNSFGIRTAAETYFKKPVRQLNLQESAMLVGMLQNPSLFNPVSHPERALRKRNQVLTKLHRHNYITTSHEYDSLSKLPVKLNFGVQNHNYGMATYFRSALHNQIARWCTENGYDIYESGLKIYTTIDSRLQHLAEQAMREHMKSLQRHFDAAWGTRDPWRDSHENEIPGFAERKLRQLSLYQDLVATFGTDTASLMREVNQKKRMRVFSWQGEKDTVMSTMDSLRYYHRFLNTGMVAIQPETGEVKVWIGGINHKYFQYDHVAQAKRQPGSTFKAFVFGKAMEDGFSPCEVFPDVAPEIKTGNTVYHPANSNGTYGDGKLYTLRQAFARSLNSIAVQLTSRLKPENVAAFAARAGIKSHLETVYSLGLGTSEVSLLEMTGAYSTFANGGICIEPWYIRRIEDKKGNVLATFGPVRKQAMSRETAWKTLHLLKGTIEEEGGTAGGISQSILDFNEAGGKTGTTDDGSDAWFVGVTSSLVTGVWVGGIERSIRFPDWKTGSGGRAALPMWDGFMKKVYNYPITGFSKGSFPAPEGIDPRMLECAEDQNDFRVTP